MHGAPGKWWWCGTPWQCLDWLGRHVETTDHPHARAADGLRSVVMVTRDVTEQEENRNQLAASAQYLRRTLNATGDAIFASLTRTTRTRRCASSTSRCS